VAGFRDNKLEKKAKQAIKKSGVTFPSQELADRAVKTLIPELKGVRKSFQTKQTLMKSFAEGGLGLSANEADKLITAIGGNAMPVERPQMDIQKTKNPEGALPIKEKPLAHDIKPPEKIAAPTPKLEVSSPIAPNLPKKPVHAPEPAVRDVKKKMPGVAVGPIQELSYSLVDWRRLGPNPKDRINKIENQLGVLEQDSYADRIAGQQAWHESEVVQLYEQAGLDSLNQGIPLEQVLSSGSENQLSFDEWKAVTELNHRIRA